MMDMIHPMMLVRCVGLAIWLYSLLGLVICAKRKQWEGCVKFLGYGLVGTTLFLVKKWQGLQSSWVVQSLLVVNRNK